MERKTALVVFIVVVRWMMGCVRLFKIHMAATLMGELNMAKCTACHLATGRMAV